MIAQEQKPMEEILGYLDGKQKIVAVGCGGCATSVSYTHLTLPTTPYV